MHKILLVDDMRNFLDLTQSFLQRAECRLFTASTGLEAVRVVRNESPDLVVLDIEMPEMNGIEACRIIKADPVMSRTCVVMLTSLSREEESRRAGADHFLKKPIDEETFLGEIKRFLPIVEREEPRCAVNLPAGLLADGRETIVRVTDLSRSGAFIAGVDPQPAIGEQFTLRVTLPTDRLGETHITPRAVVVRSTARGVGVRFLEITSGAKYLLADYLSRVCAG